jgi:hypothetical protein
MRGAGCYVNRKYRVRSVTRSSAVRRGSDLIDYYNTTAYKVKSFYFKDIRKIAIKELDIREYSAIIKA